MTGRTWLMSFLLTTLIVYLLFGPIFVVRVQGRSMEPTLHTGQLLLAKRLTYSEGVHVGDIVILRHEGRNLVKRVAVGPGDRFLEVFNGEWVDVATPHGIDHTRRAFQRLGFRTRIYQIPPGSVYVLGDNEPYSEDSRIFGPVSLEDVIAVVVEPAS